MENRRTKSIVFGTRCAKVIQVFVHGKTLTIGYALIYQQITPAASSKLLLIVDNSIETSVCPRKVFIYGEYQTKTKHREKGPSTSVPAESKVLTAKARFL